MFDAVSLFRSPHIYVDVVSAFRNKASTTAIINADPQGDPAISDAIRSEPILGSLLKPRKVSFADHLVEIRYVPSTTKNPTENTGTFQSCCVPFSAWFRDFKSHENEEASNALKFAFAPIETSVWVAPRRNCMQ